MMIEERQATLHRVRHLHPIAEIAEDVVGQHRLRPDVERLVHHVAAGDLPLHIQSVHQQTVRVALRIRAAEVVARHREQTVADLRPRLELRRDEAERTPNAFDLRAGLRHQEARRHAVRLLELREQLLRVAASSPRCHTARVAAEVRVAGEDLVAPLARHARP